MLKGRIESDAPDEPRRCPGVQGQQFVLLRTCSDSATAPPVDRDDPSVPDAQKRYNRSKVDLDGTHHQLLL